MILLRAKAKINLFFHIIGKREDSYHLIESLVVFADNVYDTLQLSSSLTNSTKTIAGDFAHLLKDKQDNLLDKVFNIFSSEEKYLCELKKNIPIGAGLGGGSSDAATLAKFLNVKQINISEDLIKIGADLPICYYNAPAFCGGIGENIVGVKNFPSLYLVLVNPNKSLLTSEVFKANSYKNTLSIQPYIIDFMNDIDKLISFLRPLQNDLTMAAIKLMPEIEDIIDLLSSQNGCEISRMSGSGSTCFGLFKNQDLAMNAALKIAELKSDYWVKYTKV